MRWPAEGSMLRRSPRLALLYVVIMLFGLSCQIAGAITHVKWIGLLGVVALAISFGLFWVLIFRYRPGEGGRPNPRS